MRRAELLSIARKQVFQHAAWSLRTARLKVVWNDEGKKIVDLGVAADAKVDVIRIDGLRKRIDANRALVSIEVSSEPVLVLYRQPIAAAK